MTKKEKCRTWTSWVDKNLLAKWYGYLEAKEDIVKVEQLTIDAINEYIKRHPLTAEEKMMATIIEKRKRKEYKLPPEPEAPQEEQLTGQISLEDVLDNNDRDETVNYEQAYREFFEGNLSKADVMKKLKIKNTTFYKYKKIFESKAQ